ncbi:tyrosine-type recombinase/integrase [Parafrankia sp. BMG5.11]|uniref:tyrosine-type recombinase/integrase n=1 Tax=Parafrankia sp. BMG5.11 TaxID=222540 RepID=UPI0014043743|nr:tyrosine-type recombinase/integrase [Parafrankia sp. BMG5.11]
MVQATSRQRGDHTLTAGTDVTTEGRQEARPGAARRRDPSRSGHLRRQDARRPRDNPIIRCLLDSGGRRTEITKLRVDDVDLTRKMLHVLGKENRPRPAPIGNNTALALDRYLRMRARDKHANRPELWLADRGRSPLTGDGPARATP